VRAEHGVIVYRKGADPSHNDRALVELRTLVLEPEEWETSLYPNLAVARDDASGGYALQVGPDDPRGPGHLYWGPYCTLPPGEYEVEYRVAAEGEAGYPPDQLVATLDVYRAGETLTERQLRFRDFARPLAWQTFTLRFRPTEADSYEFRVFYHDAGTLALDVIKVRRVGD